MNDKLLESMLKDTLARYQNGVIQQYPKDPIKISYDLREILTTEKQLIEDHYKDKEIPEHVQEAYQKASNAPEKLLYIRIAVNYLKAGTTTTAFAHFMKMGNQKPAEVRAKILKHAISDLIMSGIQWREALASAHNQQPEENEELELENK